MRRFCAGPNQDVYTSTRVYLDASKCKGKSLTYRWEIILKPKRSHAVLFRKNSAKASFKADMDGTYVVKLVLCHSLAPFVDDRRFPFDNRNCQIDTVTITARANQRAVANAGVDQEVKTSSTVTLDGSGSLDLDGDSLRYQWEFTDRPSGSTATLSDATAVHPTFVPDIDGRYVIELIVYDSVGSSLADSVEIVANTSCWGSAEPIVAYPIDDTSPSPQTVIVDGHPVPVSGDAHSPQIAMDAHGNAIAVWVMENSIRTNRYDAECGWGVERVLSGVFTPVQYECSDPKIAMDADGNAIIVFLEQYDALAPLIRAIHCRVGEGWDSGTPVAIESSYDTSYALDSPQIAMNDTGQAFVVYPILNQGTGHHNLLVNHYVEGSGWNTGEIVDSNDAGPTAPQIAMDNSGNAIVVWQESDGSHIDIWANHYMPGSGWGTAERIETDEGPASSPQIAMDESGNAIAVWHQTIIVGMDEPDWDPLGSTKSTIWSNRCVLGSGWGTAESVDGFNWMRAYPDNPEIAMNAGGDATVVWTENDDGTTSDIMSRRYEAATGWEPSSRSLVHGVFGGPKVNMDVHGNSTVVYLLFDDSGYTAAGVSRYIAGSGWSGSELIDTDIDQITMSAEIAMSAHGSAIAIWEKYGSIWANRCQYYTN